MNLVNNINDPIHAERFHQFTNQHDIHQQKTDKNNAILKTFDKPTEQMLEQISNKIGKDKEFSRYLTKMTFESIKNQDPLNDQSQVDLDKIVQKIYKLDSDNFNYILEGRKILKQEEAYHLLNLLNTDVSYYDKENKSNKSKVVSLEKADSEIEYLLGLDNGEKILKNQILSVRNTK